VAVAGPGRVPGRLGFSALPTGAALGRVHPGIGQQLVEVAEPVDVVDLGQQRRGDRGTDARDRLQQARGLAVGVVGNAVSLDCSTCDQVELGVDDVVGRLAAVQEAKAALLARLRPIEQLLVVRARAPAGRGGKGAWGGVGSRSCNFRLIPFEHLSPQARRQPGGWSARHSWTLHPRGLVLPWMRLAPSVRHRLNGVIKVPSGARQRRHVVVTRIASADPADAVSIAGWCRSDVGGPGAAWRPRWAGAEHSGSGAAERRQQIRIATPRR
jgi:hypothetical protein